VEGEEGEGEDKDDLFFGACIEGGLVLDVPTENHMCPQLWHYQQVAGVTRPSLFLNTAQRKRIRFHDLRATDITMRAVRGDNPLAIMEEVGHDGFATTQGYITTARAMGKDLGEPFPELPLSLLATETVTLTRTEVAELFGVSQATVRRMEGKELRPFGVRGIYRFERRQAGGLAKKLNRPVRVGFQSSTESSTVDEGGAQAVESWH